MNLFNITALVGTEDQRELRYIDSHTRSIIKGLTWRIIATGTTFTIAYLISGDTTMAMKVGGLDFVIKLLFYYGHERAWLRVPNGFFRKFKLR